MSYNPKELYRVSLDKEQSFQRHHLIPIPPSHLTKAAAWSPAWHPARPAGLSVLATDHHRTAGLRAGTSRSPREKPRCRGQGTQTAPQTSGPFGLETTW